MAVEDDAIVSLESDDGRAYACRLLGVFTSEGRDYMLLKRVDENGDVATDGGDSVVVMRLIEHEGHATFQRVESDEEFERVVGRLRELAGGADGHR